ncbi:MAG TPA: glycoside hydrolase family 99-like domain-containing protein, partial [Phycisphaerae bacterium]|nr:glycoside hydrolase family 99-like domain-containing protein [Phycisphaerae bacterium]
MTMRWYPVPTPAALALLLIAGTAAAEPVATKPAGSTAFSWSFDEAARWNGWSPNDMVREARFENDCVSFQTSGSDPIIISPAFEWPRATNGQRVEIDIDCEAVGEGELFFTNTTQEPNGGFRGKWFVPVAVPTAGRQVVPVWPFWETLGKVVQVRFDPPSGMRCRLYGIRIVGDEAAPGAPSWTFGDGATSWQSMYAARLEATASGLNVHAIRPMALIATSVEPFAAERRSILRLDADCPGEHSICLYWADRENSGLWGEPIDLPVNGRAPITIDLRRYPEWKGTITNLAIGFGTYGRETLTLRSLAIEENDPKKAFLRVRYLGYASGVGRPGRPAEVRAVLEHAAGPALPAGKTNIQPDENASCPESTLPIAAMALGDRVELRTRIVPRTAGQTRVTLAVNKQTFSRTLRVESAIGEVARGDYDVPTPKPVKTDYQIGIYYFPGWSPDQIIWKQQADMPERDSLLGWYEEGRPEVADWHIKWAVENGLSFFVYDWYWRDGQEKLGAALNEGFLKARYNGLMKFAIMWANHKPFSSHTREQLLAVTDYWIEHYLRRPNYLTVDGKPYVSFFSPEELLTNLGSPEKVGEVFEAMRERVRTAGLPGLHFGAIETSGPIEYETLKKAGFDSITAYNYFRTGTTVAHSLYRQYLIGCRTKWEHARRADVLPYIPLMGIGWDGPVWYDPRSDRRRGRRTEDLAEGLAQLKSFLDETGGRMAILEAWNEFGEGSYIEPNLEFGFGDVEAVRGVFSRPGDWPINVGPEDVGLGGEYDLRNEPAGCRAATKYGKVVELAAVNPAVVSGLRVRCWENRLSLEAGEARVGERVLKYSGGCVTVPPAETRKVELPITLQAGEVKNWLGGNRMLIAQNDRRNLLPGSYVAGSLRLVDPAHPETIFEPKRDYLIDDTWGAFAITAGGGLKAERKVAARYTMSLRRVDALVLDA